MSHSRRRTPITGATWASNDRVGKRNAHKALRQAERRAIVRDLPGPRMIDVSDDWDFPKDGKVAWFRPRPLDADARRRALAK